MEENHDYFMNGDTVCCLSQHRRNSVIAADFKSTVQNDSAYFSLKHSAVVIHTLAPSPSHSPPVFLHVSLQLRLWH